MNKTEPGEFFLFRVFTPKGRFHLLIEADSWEQAEGLTRDMFGLIKIEIKELRRAKHDTGGPEEGITLMRARDPEPQYQTWRGMSLLAAENLWRALGMGVLFEAQTVAAEAQIAKEFGLNE